MALPAEPPFPLPLAGACGVSSGLPPACVLSTSNDSCRVQARAPPPHSGVARGANLAQLQVGDGAGIDEGLCDDGQAGIDVVCLLYVEDKLGVF